MKYRRFTKVITGELRKHTGWLIPVASAVGVATTAYLASKATLRASEAVNEDEMLCGTAEDDKERIKNAVQIGWRYYIPTVVSGATTVGIVSLGSYSMTKRTVAAVSAASMAEKAFTEYRRSVVEQIGEKQERLISESVTKRQIEASPPLDKNIIMIGNKTVTCCELYTGRYFKSDMETIRRAVNEINSRILHELYVTLDELYSLLDLPVTTESSNLGWDSDKLLELEYATILHDDTPCLTFKYNYVKAL